MATDASNDINPGKPPKRNPNAFPLDERMFTLLREEDLELITQYTGIQDHEKLKTHIMDIQKEAYPVSFPRLRVCGVVAYTFPPRTGHALPVHSIFLLRGVRAPIGLLTCCKD